MDQPGKVVNPTRGQMNRKNEYFPDTIRAREVENGPFPAVTEGGGSREDAVSSPVGKGPFSENGIEPTLAFATLSPATAPLHDGGNRSRVEVLLPVVDESDPSRGGFRDSRSAAFSKLDEADGARIDAGIASPSLSLPLPLWSWASEHGEDHLEGNLCVDLELARLCAGDLVEERLKHKLGPGVPGEPAVLSLPLPLWLRASERGEDQLEGDLCADLELARLWAGALVEERRKDKLGPGVQGEPAVLSVASPGSDEDARE